MNKIKIAYLSGFDTLIVNSGFLSPIFFAFECIINTRIPNMPPDTAPVIDNTPIKFLTPAR